MNIRERDMFDRLLAYLQAHVDYEDREQREFVADAVRVRHDCRQLEPQLSRDPLIVSADMMAGAIDRLVRTGKADARSPAGDALLDYAQVRYSGEIGESGDWIGAVRGRYTEILEQRRKAP